MCSAASDEIEIRRGQNSACFANQHNRAVVMRHLEVAACIRERQIAKPAGMIHKAQSVLAVDKILDPVLAAVFAKDKDIGAAIPCQTVIAFSTVQQVVALTTKQIMMLRVAVGAETGKTDLGAIRKSITSLASAKAVTQELNESHAELEAKYNHAQTHVTGFTAAYARRLEWLSKYYATAQVQLPQLMTSYEAAVKEQRAGGTGWRGAIGFLPERMNTELGVLVNAMTRAHIRLYC